MAGGGDGRDNRAGEAPGRGHDRTADVHLLPTRSNPVHHAQGFLAG